jgi:hypothetical protein
LPLSACASTLSRLEDDVNHGLLFDLDRDLLPAQAERPVDVGVTVLQYAVWV